MNKGGGALGFWAKVSSRGKIKGVRHLREVHSQSQFSFMVSYGWLGTGFDTAAGAPCFLCVVPAAMWAVPLLKWDVRFTFKKTCLLCSGMPLTLDGSLNRFAPRHTRGLWWLQFWRLWPAGLRFLTEPCSFCASRSWRTLGKKRQQKITTHARTHRHTASVLPRSFSPFKKKCFANTRAEEQFINLDDGIFTGGGNVPGVIDRCWLFHTQSSNATSS